MDAPDELVAVTKAIVEHVKRTNDCEATGKVGFWIDYIAAGNGKKYSMLCTVNSSRVMLNDHMNLQARTVELGDPDMFAKLDEAILELRGARRAEPSLATALPRHKEVPTHALV